MKNKYNITQKTIEGASIGALGGFASHVIFEYINGFASRTPKKLGDVTKSSIATVIIGAGIAGFMANESARRANKACQLSQER